MQKLRFISIYKSIFLLFSIVLLPKVSMAQWEIGASIGIPTPITGYSEVVKPGWLISVEGKNRLGKGNLALGMETSFARFVNDKNKSDKFFNTKLTVAPILFVTEYEAFQDSKLRPYVAAGLGVSLFDLYYETGTTMGESNFNASFTLSPQAGLRYKLSENLSSFVEGHLILLADGPPMDVPQAGKMSGYGGISFGINYQFNK